MKFAEVLNYLQEKTHCNSPLKGLFELKLLDRKNYVNIILLHSIQLNHLFPRNLR